MLYENLAQKILGGVFFFFPLFCVKKQSKGELLLVPGSGHSTYKKNSNNLSF